MKIVPWTMSILCWFCETPLCAEEADVKVGFIDISGGVRTETVRLDEDPTTKKPVLHHETSYGCRGVHPHVICPTCKTANFIPYGQVPSRVVATARAAYAESLRASTQA